MQYDRVVAGAVAGTIAVAGAVAVAGAGAGAVAGAVAGRLDEKYIYVRRPSGGLVTGPEGHAVLPLHPAHLVSLLV